MKISQVTLFLTLSCSFAQADVQKYANQRNKPVVGLKGMVVSDDRKASEWGVEILKKGGNAVDAAVATAFYLAVTRPNYASLGGGGFMIVCKAKEADCTAIDYREKAPHKSTADMFLIDGKAKAELSQDGALASGIPGVTSGLLAAHAKFGKIPRKILLSRPIEAAQKGFIFSANLQAGLSDRWGAMNEEGHRIFSCGRKNSYCEPGDLVKQGDLAKVLLEISKKGELGFYDGWVAKKVATEIKKAGGIFSTEDLKTYKSEMIAPMVSEYKSHEIITMPLPSSGGIIEQQLFFYAEKADATDAFAQGFASTASTHALATAMSLAFADRAKFMGDDSLSNQKVPTDTLLSEAYLNERWKLYSPKLFKNPEAAKISAKEGENTTHFSVIDKEGNAVAVTTTLNDNFGSAFVVPGTGIVMNNEMDDFISAPGVANMFGLVGSKANEIAPGKRPLSSMSPTIVRDSSTRENEIVIGGAGGPRIPTATFLALFNRLRFNMGIADAVSAGRFHQQWSPLDLMIEENSLSPEVISELQKLGHKTKFIKASARLQALERLSSGTVWGYSDPRSEGAAVSE